MAPKPQITKALDAMKDIGIPVHTTKRVLKKLLQVYENNWEYIEAENYRVLADAILDLQESKVQPKLLGHYLVGFCLFFFKLAF